MARNAISNDPKQTGLTDETVTGIVKRRGKGPTPGSRPDKRELWEIKAEPGEIGKIVSDAVKISRWPPIDTNDADQVIERIAQYYDYCVTNDVKPDMSGMALAIGVSRQMLWKWENGVESNKPEAVRVALKKGREINETVTVNLMQANRLNPIPALFLLKNNHGYKDQTDVVVTPNSPLDGMDQAEARNRYAGAIPEIATDSADE